MTRTAATASGTVGTIVQTGAVGPNGRVLVAPSTGMVTSVTLTFDNADGSPVTAGVENVGNKLYREHLDPLAGGLLYRPGTNFYLSTQWKY